ncbi:hypothetical protein MMC14_004687 [Varicellaria rhodocarpa]|nr:hypothetical protein [Varicellaria rhodocarpa]
MSTLSPKRPPQLPVNFSATPVSLIQDAQRLVDEFHQLENTIVSKIQPQEATFYNVLLPLIHLENRTSGDIQRIRFFASVSPFKELRDASTKAAQLLANAEIDSEMREDIYKLVEAVVKKDERLDSESQYYLQKKYRSYVKNGLGILLDTDRDRFKEIRKRMADLRRGCIKNINADTNGIWFTHEELDGVPDDTMTNLEKGEGENADKLKLTFKKPDFNAAMAFAVRSRTRRTVKIESERRFKENIPSFHELVVLRDEAARLLGYPNHAAFKLD